MHLLLDLIYFKTKKKIGACNLLILFNLSCKMDDFLMLDLEDLMIFSELRSRLWALKYKIYVYFTLMKQIQMKSKLWTEQSNQVKCWFWGRKRRKEMLVSLKIHSGALRWNVEGLCLWKVLKRVKKQTISTSSLI